MSPTRFGLPGGGGSSRSMATGAVGATRRLSLCLAALAVAALLLAGAGPAAAKVTHDKSGSRVSRTTPEDWLRHPHDDKYYTENWTAIFRSGEGHILYIQFLYSNIGVLSGNAAVNVAFTMPGKMAEHLVFQYDLASFAEDAKTGRIGIGSDYMTLDGKSFSLRVKEKGVDIALDGKAWGKGVKFHAGKTYFDDDKTQWAETYFNVPRADVAGEISVGANQVKVKGALYVDHWVQNAIGTDFSSRWWVARLFADDYTVVAMVYKLSKAKGGGTVKRFILLDRSGVVDVTDSLTFDADTRRTDPNGHSYDTRYTLAYEGKKLTLEGTVTGKADLHDRDCILDRMNAAERQIVKLFAGTPVVYRMEGEASLTLTPAGGQARRLEGTALMESIVLGND